MKTLYKKSAVTSTALLFLAGCSNGSLAALCSATAEDRDKAALATLKEGTDNVVTTVQPLISKVDAACP